MEKSEISDSIGNFILTAVDKIEEELQRILEEGLDDDNSIYLYLGDLKSAAKVLKK